MAAPKSVHVWGEEELTFNARMHIRTHIWMSIIWVNLTGARFNKRIYGFWDGAGLFIFALLQYSPAHGIWKSGSIPEDPG